MTIFGGQHLEDLSASELVSAGEHVVFAALAALEAGVTDFSGFIADAAEVDAEIRLRLDV